MAKNIFVVTKTTIHFYHSVSLQLTQYKPTAAFKWNSDNLAKTVAQIKAKYKINSADILLGDDIAYSFSMVIDIEEDRELTRDFIEEKILGVVPLDRHEVFWDYKTTSKERGKEVVQVTAMSKKMAKLLGDSLTNNQIKVGIVESVSDAISRVLRDKDYPYIAYVSVADANILVLGKAHAVYFAKSISDISQLQTDIKTFIEYATDNSFSEEKNAFIAPENVPGINIAELEKLGWQSEPMSIEPIVGLLHKDDKKGKDEEVLNLKIDKTEDEDWLTNKEKILGMIGQYREKRIEKSGKHNKSKTKNQLPLLLGILVFMVVAAGIAIFIYLKRGEETQSIVVQEPTFDEQVVPEKIQVLDDTLELDEDEAVEETVVITDPSKYSVMVLNGSGIAGQAGTVESLLEKAGFIDVSTANANSFDYEKTEIRVKESVAGQFSFDFSKALVEYNLDYPDEFLEPDSEYDIEVIVGVGYEN